MFKTMLTILAAVAACAIAACAPALSRPETASDLSLMQKRLAASEEKVEALSQQVALLQTLVDSHQRALQDLSDTDAARGGGTPSLSPAPPAESDAAPAVEKAPETIGTAALQSESLPDLQEETPAPAAEDLPTSDATNSQYRQAMDILQSGDVEAAAPLFEAFAAEFPGDDLADNALYWAGECKYTQKKFAEAIQCFKRVVAEYPDGSKVPDALLKTGYAYISLGETESAAIYLKQVVAQYPFSDAGVKAEERLKALR